MKDLGIESQHLLVINKVLNVSDAKANAMTLGCFKIKYEKMISSSYKNVYVHVHVYVWMPGKRQRSLVFQTLLQSSCCISHYYMYAFLFH